MSHGSHIYAKASDMEKATMCTYSQSDNALLHWKCVLCFCADCPCINITDQITTPSIWFHIYHIIACCTAHGKFH